MSDEILTLDWKGKKQTSQPDCAPALAEVIFAFPFA